MSRWPKREIGVAVGVILAEIAWAANVVWDGDSDTVFSNAANWVGGVAPVDHISNDIAVFPSSFTPFQPTLTADRSIRGLSFQKTDGGWILGGTGYLLRVGASAISDLATAGTNAIEADITVGYDGVMPGSFNLSSGGTLMLSGRAIIWGGTNRNFTVNKGTAIVNIVDAKMPTINFTKSGDGTLILRGPAGTNFQGGFTLGGDGTLIVQHPKAMGVGPFTFNKSTIRVETDMAGSNARTTAVDICIEGNCTFEGVASIEFSGIGRVNAASNIDKRTITNNLSGGQSLIFSGPLFSLAERRAAGEVRTITFSGTGNTRISASIVDFISNGGVGALTLAGSGTITLSGSNTYTGGTFINNGTLLFNGTHLATAGAYSVSNTATLSGTGTTVASVVVNSGGIIAPGHNGIGTLRVGPTTFSAGSKLAWERGRSSSDLLEVTGNLTIATNFTIVITEQGRGPTTADLIKYTGTFTGNPNAWTIQAPPGYEGVTVTNTGSAIRLLGLPEPSLIGTVISFR
jgi:autotransporter-associated beta strand protein